MQMNSHTKGKQIRNQSVCGMSQALRAFFILFAQKPRRKFQFHIIINSLWGNWIFSKCYRKTIKKLYIVIITIDTIKITRATLDTKIMNARQKQKGTLKYCKKIKTKISTTMRRNSETISSKHIHYICALCTLNQWWILSQTSQWHSDRFVFFSLSKFAPKATTPTRSSN